MYFKQKSLWTNDLAFSTDLNDLPPIIEKLPVEKRIKVGKCFKLDIKNIPGNVSTL